MQNILLAGLLVMLTACGTVQKKFALPPDQSLWQQHKSQVATINQWNIQGRVSIQTEYNGGQADLFWNQQDDQNYDIRLIAPFGGGTSYIQARPQGASLTTTDGQQVVADDAEALLRDVQGMRFPVGGLRYWILGVPSPQSEHQLIHWNARGYLQLLQQDGWRIEMRDYKAEGPYYLPKKLFVSRIDHEEKIDLRLVIRQWNLAGE
ncbi:MAG: lipoprotein insertase outer membrane protein LolB [Gammaproteobacteria bacterium]|nr:lipoprotein insertase outer membrane protein LolB [Gammaproteobacteria bacterium]